MFCTGTMGELAPVTKVDGRVIGRMTASISDAAGSTAGGAGPMTRRLSELFKQLTETEGYPIVADETVASDSGGIR
jgi:branched-chain amino acid aminotransferase